MKPQQAVIFDLDGTLLDTLEDLANSGNEVLAGRGFPTHPVKAYQSFIGDGMANLVQRIFPEEHRPSPGPESDLALAEYRAAYERHWQVTTSLFPGIEELLENLVKNEIPIAVLSNKAHDFARKCVDAFLGKWEWSLVLGARENIPQKPDPTAAREIADQVGVPPASCFFIGDSDVDMLTARHAGMQAIGVSWGFRSVDELKQSGAVAILDNPDDLIAIMSRASDE